MIETGLMAKNLVDKTCKDVRWMTPDRILDPVRAYFGGPIPLDPATEPNNPTRACKFFTKETNGLTQPWTLPVFCNPPYGKGIPDWCEKFYLESQRGVEIVALLPCGSGRPGTKYWQRFILQERLNVICYVKGRVAFLRPDGTPVKQNTYPSQLIGLNCDVERFAECFGHLGKVVSTVVLSIPKQP